MLVASVVCISVVRLGGRKEVSKCCYMKAGAFMKTHADKFPANSCRKKGWKRAVMYTRQSTCFCSADSILIAHTVAVQRVGRNLESLYILLLLG
jgi:hypothetical protein